MLQEHRIQRTRTIRKTGEVQTYKVGPKGDDNPIAELEGAMLACINMDTEPPDIDYDALIDLQQKRMGIMPEEEAIESVEAQHPPAPFNKQPVERNSELREALSEIRLYKDMLAYAGKEFARRHGRRWRWTKILHVRNGNRVLKDEDGKTFAMGIERWQVVAVLARFIETGIDNVGAFEE